MTTVNTSEIAKRAINNDRAPRLVDEMLKQEAGCVFLAPINIYTGSGKILPRGIFDKIQALNSGDLSVKMSDLFRVWKELLPLLDMSIQKILMFVHSFTIEDKPFADILNTSGLSHINVENVSHMHPVSLEAGLSWMFIMANPHDTSSLHVMSALQGNYSTLYLNEGGQKELDEYLQRGYIIVLAIGLSMDSKTNSNGSRENGKKIPFLTNLRNRLRGSGSKSA